MASKLFDNAQGLPWSKSLNAPNDDEHSDRLNHRYTVGFLVICAVIASGSPIVFNRINCWVPAQFVGAYSTYTNNYCWVSNTYYIPSNVTVPYSRFDRERAEIGYYQWTPFIFLFFALCFYFPRMLWRSMNTRSGIDLQYLIKKGEAKSIVGPIEHYCEPNQYDHNRHRFFRTLSCTGGKRLGNYLRSIQVMVKLLYLINSIIQLALIHLVLGQPGWFYGIDIWYSIFVQNSVLTDSPYFPRVTLCDLRIREVGNLHRYTVQCVLPINMLNEKIFTLAWFWFIYVVISNIFSFISTLYDMTIENSRIHFIRDLYRTSINESKIDKEELKKFTQDYLMQDGVLIIQIINNNGSARLAAEVVNRLFTNYEKNQKEQLKRKTTPQFTSSDV
jgi:hypothetical protein